MGLLIYFFTALFLLLPACLAAQNHTETSLNEQIAQADSYLSEDRLDEALHTYRLAVKAHPKSAVAHQRLSKALSLSGSLSAAAHEAQRAIEIDPLNADAHSNLGWIWGVQKDYHQAIQEERIAIHLDPSNASSHLTLALALASIGDYEGASVANQAAIALEPDNLKAYVNLGATLGRKGDYQQASEAYRRALAINPDSVSAHLGLGAALGKLGRYKEQVTEFQTAVKLAPHSDNAHGKLGWALYKTGDYDGAIKEGCITNWLRLSKSGPQYLHTFIGLWGGIFLLFGLIFAVIFFGSHFKPMTGELVDKSYFLIFHKDKPGRFVLTNKRLVFVPEAFSAWFGAQTISINKEDIEKLDTVAGGKGTLQIILRDGTAYSFTMPPLVAKPFLASLKIPSSDGP